MDDLETMRARIMAVIPATTGTRYFGVPSNRTLRWILPSDRRAASAVLKQWRPYGIQSRVAYHLLRLLVTVLGPAQTPGLVALDSPPTKPDATWPITGELVIYVGTPSPSRKAACYLVDENQHIVAVAKLAIAESAAPMVLAEANALGALTRELPQVRAPKILYLDSKNGMSIQTPIVGSAVGRKCDADIVDFLLSLTTQGTISLSHRAQVLSPKIATIALSGIDVSVIDTFLEGVSGTVSRVWFHGDFAPWNLRRLPEGIAAFDWETARPDGLPLHDAVDFHCSQFHLLGGGKPPYIAMRDNNETHRYLASIGLNWTVGSSLFRLCCLESASTAFAKGNVGYATFLLRQFQGCEEH